MKHRNLALVMVMFALSACGAQSTRLQKLNLK